MSGCGRVLVKFYSWALTFELHRIFIKYSFPFHLFNHSQIEKPFSACLLCKHRRWLDLPESQSSLTSALLERQNLHLPHRIKTSSPQGQAVGHSLLFTSLAFLPPVLENKSNSLFCRLCPQSLGICFQVWRR